MTTTVLEHVPAVARASAHDPGVGHIELARVGGRTVVVRASATSPLKLLTPRSGRGEGAWICTSTYGGGLVGGDAISLNVVAGEATRALLTTQASTKVYRTEGIGCAQSLHVSIGQGAIVVSAPDPIVCFAGAIFEQTQSFELAADAGLVMIDWFTSGRRARGERWAFSKYSSRTEIRIDGRCVFRDPILLDPADGALAGPMRMGRCDCFATLVIAGKPLRAHVEQMQFDDGGESVLYSVSPMDQGVVVRVAGHDPESVGRWIRSRLSFVEELVGHDPWSRKW